MASSGYTHSTTSLSSSSSLLSLVVSVVGNGAIQCRAVFWFLWLVVAKSCWLSLSAHSFVHSSVKPVLPARNPGCCQVAGPGFQKWLLATWAGPQSSPLCNLYVVTLSLHSILTPSTSSLFTDSEVLDGSHSHLFAPLSPGRRGLIHHRHENQWPSPAMVHIQHLLWTRSYQGSLGAPLGSCPSLGRQQKAHLMLGDSQGKEGSCQVSILVTMYPKEGQGKEQRQPCGLAGAT